MCVACIVLIRRSYPNASTVSAITDNKQIASGNAIAHVDDRTHGRQNREELTKANDLRNSHFMHTNEERKSERSDRQIAYSHKPPCLKIEDE